MAVFVSFSGYKRRRQQDDPQAALKAAAYETLGLTGVKT
jgi:hypothetical protein